MCMDVCVWGGGGGGGMCVYILKDFKHSSVYVRFILHRTLLVSWLPLGTMLRVSELSLTVSLLLRVRCHRCK